MLLKSILSAVALPPLALAYTTIDSASDSASRWSAGQFVALVDVRRADEWDAGHLPNATFIESLQENMDTSRLEGCEDCPIAVYCRSGRRSKEAAVVLEAAGFRNVYDVLGVNQWTDAGIELVVDEERDPTCCDASCPEIENSSASGGWGNVNTLVVLVLAVAGAVANL